MAENSLYHELRDLAVHDATIYAHLKTQEASGASDRETLISMVKRLAAEKKSYFDLATNAINTRTQPMILPDYLSMFGEDKK